MEVGSFHGSTIPVSRVQALGRLLRYDTVAGICVDPPKVDMTVKVHYCLIPFYALYGYMKFPDFLVPRFIDNEIIFLSYPPNFQSQKMERCSQQRDVEHTSMLQVICLRYLRQ